MEAKQALIAWTPNTSEIEVGPWPDLTRWSRKYRMTAGACFPSWHEMSRTKRLLFMFINFNSIVVRDRVDPQAAHQAFLSIDEYRQLISPDQAGADPESLSL